MLVLLVAVFVVFAGATATAPPGFTAQQRYSVFAATLNAIANDAGSSPEARTGLIMKIRKESAAVLKQLEDQFGPIDVTVPTAKK